ncbi:MAG: hypothetical protein L0H63_02375 [Nitrococcus sp.]|nr:hypothetical protein [Nitrococcus sp.]
MGEMLTASAMQHFEADIAKAVVLTLFIPLFCNGSRERACTGADVGRPS